MPVVAIAGIVQGGMALAEGGLTLFQTISAVGAIAGGIGELTGNKELRNVGAVAALGGAAGAYAQGKGWIASDGPLADTSSNIEAMLKQAAPNTPDASANTSASPSTVDSADSSTTGAIQQAVSQPGLSSASLADNSGASPGGTSSPNIGSAPSTATMGGPAADIPKGDWGPGGLPGSSQASSGGGILGTFKSFGDWANQNKQLASMLGNFVGGMFDSEKKAKSDYYQSQVDMTRQQIENMRSTPNMNIGPAGKVGFPSTPPTYTPPRLGLAFATGR